MNAQQHAEMMRQIQEHGENLKKVFNLPTDTDPLALCKKLRRIETKATYYTTAYCNGDIDMAQVDAATDRAKASVEKILGPTPEIFVNRDPRGYALKIDDEIMKAHDYKLYRDWGGYGIIAPDFTPNA